MKHRKHRGFEENILLLGIDALCIDQSRFHERSHQVAMMDRIYSKASNVVVWLGQSTDIIEKAMTYLGGRYYKRHTAQDWLQSSEGIEALCTNMYWTRVWVVQEYALASSVEIWCGQDWMSGLTLAWLLENRWKCMEKASAEDRRKHARSDRFSHRAHRTWESPAMKIVGFRQERLGKQDHGLGLMDLLGSFGHYLQSPLSLIELSERQKLFIVPDYSKSRIELFQNVYEAVQKFEPYNRTWRLKPIVLPLAETGPERRRRISEKCAGEGRPEAELLVCPRAELGKICEGSKLKGGRRQ
jgi:hypothetical protein